MLTTGTFSINWQLLHTKLTYRPCSSLGNYARELRKLKRYPLWKRKISLQPTVAEYEKLNVTSRRKRLSVPAGKISFSTFISLQNKEINVMFNKGKLDHVDRGGGNCSQLCSCLQKIAKREHERKARKMRPPTSPKKRQTYPTRSLFRKTSAVLVLLVTLQNLEAKCATAAKRLKREFWLGFW